jgi:Sulfotransferase family
VSVLPKITLVCLLSSPHSGSTILGASLAAHPDVVYAGELFEIPAPAWTPGRPCACGRPAPECPFWKGVRHRVELVGPLDRFDRGEREYDRWLALPRWWLGHRRLSGTTLQYTAYLEALVRGIATESGRHIVIDTSKILSRALAYDRLNSPEFEVRFVHLVRDGRDVLASRHDRRTRSASSPELLDARFDALRFSALWTGANFLIVALLKRRRGRYMRLRYEDFVRDPEESLNQLGSFLHLDLTEVGRHVAAGDPIPIGHIVAGNRLRSAGVVVLRRTAAPSVSRLAPKDQRTFRWVAGSAAHLFGYR